MEKRREAWKKLQQPQQSRHFSVASPPIFTAILSVLDSGAAASHSRQCDIFYVPRNQFASCCWEHRQEAFANPVEVENTPMLGKMVFTCTFASPLSH